VPLSGDATQKELAAIRASLSQAIESADPQEWPKVVRKTVRRIQLVIERLDKAQSGKKKSASLKSKVATAGKIQT
jgi:hypothetical protein